MMRSFKVMIADDMEVFRRQIRRLPFWKEEMPFELVAEASDGVEALKFLQKTPVDLLITDIKMPRMDGLALLKEVRSQNLAACVVFLSDYAEFSIAKEAIQYGIFDYLVKPVKEEEMSALLEKVQAHLEKAEQEALEKRKLKERILESVSLYYPTAGTAEIIRIILKGNGDLKAEVHDLIQTTFEALGKDLVRTGLVLDQVLVEVLERMEEEVLWIQTLYPLTSFYRRKPSRTADMDSMERELQEVFGRISGKIRYLVSPEDENSLISDLQQFILLHVEERLTLDRLAEEFFLTKNHLGEVFKEKTGMTLGAYMLRAKIQRAKVLLQEDLRAYEIAERLGYQSAEYFAKQFKKATGETPSEYRRRIDEKGED